MLTENVFIDNSHTYKSYVDEIIRRLEGENIKKVKFFFINKQHLFDNKQKYILCTLYFLSFLQSFNRIV